MRSERPAWLARHLIERDSVFPDHVPYRIRDRKER